MAITYDSSSSSSGISPSGAVLSFDLTVAAGSNRAVIVCPMSRVETVIGVTYDGVALTQYDDFFGSLSIYSGVWALLDSDAGGPISTGTKTVAITMSGTGQLYVAGVAWSFAGVLQASPFDADESFEIITTDPTFDALTTVADNALVIDCVATNNGSAITTLNETRLSPSYAFLSAGTGRYVGSSYYMKTPAGAVTLGWNNGGNNSCYTGVSFKPAASVSDTLFSQSSM